MGVYDEVLQQAQSVRKGPWRRCGDGSETVARSVPNQLQQKRIPLGSDSCIEHR